MLEPESNDEHKTAPCDEPREPHQAAEAAPRSSTVRFGLRTAVLACVIATSGGMTTGLGSAINSAAGSTDTTCCGINQPPSVIRTI